jgi:RNA polymerase sigma-70 factor (ECF subfamily)
MADEESTCWTVVRGAARGGRAEREEFARRYGPVIRAYLGSRWRGTPLLADVDDVEQEVFLDCFRDGGPLERADPTRAGGFRAYLFGVVRNAAREAERRRARDRLRPVGDAQAEIPADDQPGPSTMFDRAFAASLLREAGDRMARSAAERGDAAVRRVELLRLRFQEGLPIREIAARWGEEPSRVHHEYARARDEFREALLEVVGFHHPGPAAEVAAEAARLLELFR